MPALELSRKETLALLGITAPTLRKLIRQGTITAGLYAGTLYISRESVTRYRAARFAAQLAGVPCLGRPQKGTE